MFLVLLLIVPLAFSIRNGIFKKSFRLTWIIYSIVWFIYGLILPAYAKWHQEITGEYPDITGVTMFMGIMFGWLPSLILASLGCFFHNLFIKKK
jgi:type II secretory pathway component PulF